MTSLGKSVAVVGAGPGLGAALADAFADTGYQVAMLARDAERLATLASAAKSHLTAIACDATDPEAVANAFNQIAVDLGPLDCVIFTAGTLRPGGVIDTTTEDFVRSWRVGASAGYGVGREAGRTGSDSGKSAALPAGCGG